MIDYIDYEDGETGLLFSVCYEKTKYGDIDILSVAINEDNILAVLSDEVLLAIQLYVEDTIDFIELA